MSDAEQQRDALRSVLLDATDAGLVRLAAAARPRHKTEAWDTLLADRNLGAAALAAIERSGALAGDLEPRPRLIVEDLISLLGRLHHEPARALLVRLWSTGQHELRIRAGHALIEFGDGAALEVVATGLDDAERQYLALQAIFTLEPATAWNRLAPGWSKPSARAGNLMYAVLHVLMRDLTDDGRAHWGASRGWFAADPRWLELCGAWTKLPPLAQRKRWGTTTAQGIVELSGWFRKRAAAGGSRT